MSTDTFIERRTYDQGFVVEIHNDLDPMSPREWDNPIPMVLSHRRYDFPNDAGIYFGDFDGWEAVAAELRRNHGALRILPVYMYEHSGIALSTGAFSDPWDSGRVGLVYITQEFWTACMGKPYNARSSKDRKLADEIMVSEVRIYSQYLNGEVYGFVVKSPSGQPLDSCWGFLGYDDFEEMYDQGKLHVDYEIAQQAKTLVFS